MKATNFDLYLERQLKDRAFAKRFRQAGEAWDIALQLAALRQKSRTLTEGIRRNAQERRSSRFVVWSRPPTKDIH